LILVAFLGYADLGQAAMMQGSDFISDFYVAGKIVAEGNAAQLYPPEGTTSWVNTFFDQRAHQLLPALPHAVTPIYMYAPLVAASMVPFTFLPPNLALLAFQLLSIAALCLSCWLLARAASASGFSDFAWGAAMFFPIFQCLLIGQLALAMGLLPLSAGFFALARGKPFAAGLIFSVLTLKLQFLPAALLICAALLLRKRPVCLGGLLLGSVVLVGITLAIFPVHIYKLWLASLSLSNTNFTNPVYGITNHLVSSLPGLLTILTAKSLGGTASLLGWAVAGIIGLVSLAIGWKILDTTGSDDSGAAKLFVLACAILPLVSPHFLFYDLSVLFLPAVVIFAGAGTQPQAVKLRAPVLLAAAIIDAYFLTFMFVDKTLAQPLILVAGLTMVIAWMAVLLVTDNGAATDVRPSGDPPAADDPRATDVHPIPGDTPVTD
jgi:hypothetical protein